MSSKIERADALEGIASIVRQSRNKTLEHLLRANGKVKLGPKLKTWQRDLMHTEEFRLEVASIEDVVRERFQLLKHEAKTSSKASSFVPNDNVMDTKVQDVQGQVVSEHMGLGNGVAVMDCGSVNKPIAKSFVMDIPDFDVEMCQRNSVCEFDVGSIDVPVSDKWPATNNKVLCNPFTRGRQVSPDARYTNSAMLRNTFCIRLTL